MQLNNPSMDRHQSLSDDESFIVLGLGSLSSVPSTSMLANPLPEQRALDSMTSCDSTSNNIPHKLDQLLQENCQLRDALYQNNLAMKTQFEALSKWQQEVSDTHRSHKAKFEETKALVIKLKNENTALKNGSGKPTDSEALAENYTLRRQVEILKAEKLILVKERDSFREECTKMNLKISDLELAVRKKTEEVEILMRRNHQIGTKEESMQSWLRCEEPRHPLSIEVDIPSLPPKSTKVVDQGVLDNTLKLLQELQEKYDKQCQEIATQSSAYAAQLEKKDAELEKVKGELNAKDAFLRTTISELLQEKEKTQKLTSECEKLTLVQSQVEVYENDYKEERIAREKLADEKENMAVELRMLRAKIAELESRDNATANTVVLSAVPEEGMSTSPSASTALPVHTEPQATNFECPLCGMKFSDVLVCQEHVNECLDKYMQP